MESCNVVRWTTGVISVADVGAMVNGGGAIDDVENNIAKISK